MSVNLGFVPVPLTVTLVDGGGFGLQLIAPAAWPVTAVAKLRFLAPGSSPIEWPATTSGTTLTWRQTVSDVRAVLAAQSRHAQLVYTDLSIEPIVWGKGAVNAA